VLIYDTLYGEPKDVLFALEHLKPATEEKIIILISHLGVWANCGLKEKKEVEKTEPVDPDGANIDNPDNPDDNKDPANSDQKEPSAKPKLGGFDDSDDNDVKPKKEPEPKDDVKQPEPIIDVEPEEPKPPVYVPWVESDFRERLPLEE
jgi:hypothetical protein